MPGQVRSKPRQMVWFATDEAVFVPCFQMIIICPILFVFWELSAIPLALWVLRFSGSPFDPLQVKLLAGDLRAAQFYKRWDSARFSAETPFRP